MKLTCLSIAVATALLTLTTAPNAHEFNVLLVAPDNTDASTVFNAFRMATKERDGHENEDSDGHLGGLDVYIYQASDYRSFDDAVIVSTPDVIALLGEKANDTTLKSAVQATGTVLITVQSPSAAMQQDFLQTFADRFQNAFSTAPSPVALQAYSAARLIDLAVRPQDGVQDVAIWQDILSKY